MNANDVAAAPSAPGSVADASTSLLRHTYWLAPLVVFLTLRLFSADSFYMLGGDQCTYLEMGRTFPKHHLYNHELYLIHPPLFGYAIGLLNLLLPLVTSGLIATLLLAVLAFLVIRKIGDSEQLPKPAICIGLLYLAVSRAAVHYDTHVARVSILVCTMALALLAFLRFLQKPGTRRLWIVVAANVFCLLVSDQSVLLLAGEAVLFWGSDSRRHWKQLVPLAIASVLATSVWPAVRFVEYSTRNHLPAGIDGTIEFTKNFSLAAVVQPNFLPFTNVHRTLTTQTSLSIWNLNFDLLAGLPTDLLLLPSAAGIGIVLLLLIAALLSPDRRKRAAQWLLFGILCLIPVGLGMNEWYSSGYIVPFSLLMMEGAAACSAWLSARVNVSGKTLSLTLAAVSALAVVLWLAAPPREAPSFRPHGGTHFLFYRPTVTRAAIVSKFFNSAPRDTGIMAPVLLAPEIAYLTDKRVVALPFDPALLDRFIREYRIQYLLTSTQFLIRYDTPVADQYLSALVSRYVVEHPEHFHLVRQVTENYGGYYPATTYYVFEVLSTPGAASS